MWLFCTDFPSTIYAKAFWFWCLKCRFICNLLILPVLISSLFLSILTLTDILIHMTANERSCTLSSTFIVLLTHILNTWLENKHLNKITKSTICTIHSLLFNSSFPGLVCFHILPNICPFPNLENLISALFSSFRWGKKVKAPQASASKIKMLSRSQTEHYQLSDCINGIVQDLHSALLTVSLDLRGRCDSRTKSGPEAGWATACIFLTKRPQQTQRKRKNAARWNVFK